MIDIYINMILNYQIIFQFLLFILIPILIIYSIIKFIIHKIRKIKVINGIVLSVDTYDYIDYEARKHKLHTKKMISSLLEKFFNRFSLPIVLDKFPLTKL